MKTQNAPCLVIKRALSPFAPFTKQTRTDPNETQLLATKKG